MLQDESAEGPSEEDDSNVENDDNDEDDSEEKIQDREKAQQRRREIMREIFGDPSTRQRKSPKLEKKEVIDLTKSSPIGRESSNKSSGFESRG
jgi:hypothetical protein